MRQRLPPPKLKRQNSTVSNRHVSWDSSLRDVSEKSRNKAVVLKHRKLKVKRVFIRYDTEASGVAHGCNWKIIMSYRDYREGKSDCKDIPNGRLVFFSIYIDDHPEIEKLTEFSEFLKTDPSPVTRTSFGSALMMYLKQFT